MSRRLGLVAAGMVAALSLTACSTAAEDEASAGTSPSAEAPSEPPEPAEESDVASPDAAKKAKPAKPEPVDVPKELDWTVKALDGQTVEGASLAGQDAVLYFWAPWCPICRGEAPVLDDVESAYGEDVAVLGVAGLSDDVAAMSEFVSATGTGSITHLQDSGGEVYTAFGVAAQTTYAFLDDDGTVEVVPGPLPKDQLDQRVQQLVEG